MKELTVLSSGFIRFRTVSLEQFSGVTCVHHHLLILLTRSLSLRHKSHITETLCKINLCPRKQTDMTATQHSDKKPNNTCMNIFI